MNKTKYEKCWICGGEGDTGEHLLKVSDIKLYFPGLNQNNPHYYHNSSVTNVPLRSRFTKRLHSNAKLCKKCNNQRTQPYDKAWEKLSRYLYESYEIIKKRKYFDLKKIFINDYQHQANNIQLYFIKLLGCLFYDCEIPEKMQICDSFSKSLLDGSCRKDVFLSFSFNKNYIAGVSDLHVDTEYKKSINLVIAHWIYMLPYFEIKIFYSTIKKDNLG